MLDISSIPQEYISELAGAYMHAKFLYEKDPLAAPAGKQRKIRKWLCKHYAELIQKLPESADISRKEYSEVQVFALLKACEDAARTIALENEKETGAVLATFDKETKEALREVLGFIDWPAVTFLGKDIQIIVEDTLAYRKVLTLCNVTDVPEADGGCYCNDLNLLWQTEHDRYCLYGYLENYFYEWEKSFALSFETARVETTVYDVCSNSTIDENPWSYLQSVCYCIGMKAKLPGTVVNEQEKNIMPVIEEICALSYWLDFQHHPKYQLFPELKALTSRYGCKKAEALLEKLETIPTEENRYDRTVRKLLACLCEQKCQPMWREIYKKLLESQEAYPDKADTYIDQQSLSKIRRSIEIQMAAHGYIGAYPDFVKTGSMPGIHLENSYNMTYWVGMARRVQYHIHCTENYEEEDYLTIQFLCGTAFLKKDEKETDIYDCLFNAKGRRLFHLVHHYVPLPGNENAKPDDLGLSIRFAVKRAECIKLSKAEQKAFYRKSLPGWDLFWQIFLFMGGFFGISMTLGMLLIWILASIIDGTGSTLLEILQDFPWLLIMSFCWIGFGGAMGIIEVLAHRK